MNAAPVALVTGASRGIGAGIAEALARAGYDLAVNYLSDHRAAATVVERIRAGGGVAQAFPADVTSTSAAQALHEDVRRELGEVHALVLNATGPQPDVPLDDLDRKDLQDQLDHFVLGPLTLVQAVVPAMRERRAGRIVFIGSEVIDLAPAHTAAYTAAKSAQAAMARVWARELAPHGITVNTVSPGFIPGDRHRETPQAAIEDYTAQVPAGRLGTASDTGAAVAFLCSQTAAFIAGERLRVTGGHTIG